MANGQDETTQDQEDLGQDFRAPPTLTAPPLAPIAPPMPVAAPAPGRAPITPPPDLSTTLNAGGRQLPNWTGASQLQMAQTLQGVPIEKAQDAFKAALSMQVQRGMSRDLQSRMDPAEVFQKWMGSLISAQKSVPTLGQAADFIRAVRPTVSKPINVGGKLYNIEPGGRSVSLTPGQDPAAAKGTETDLHADIADTRKTLDSITKEIGAQEALEDAPNTAPTAKLLRLRQRRNDLMSYLQAKQQQLVPPPSIARGAPAPTLAGPTPAPAAPVARPGATPARIRVRSKTGKIGTIPASQLDAALAAGYTRIQ